VRNAGADASSYFFPKANKASSSEKTMQHPHTSNQIPHEFFWMCFYINLHLTFSLLLGAAPPE
jgi:hypothetical protein